MANDHSAHSISLLMNLTSAQLTFHASPGFLLTTACVFNPISDQASSSKPSPALVTNPKGVSIRRYIHHSQLHARQTNQCGNQFYFQVYSTFVQSGGERFMHSLFVHLPIVLHNLPYMAILPFPKSMAETRFNLIELRIEFYQIFVVVSNDFFSSNARVCAVSTIGSLFDP
jgi:hypothetical protein